MREMYEMSEYFADLMQTKKKVYVAVGYNQYYGEILDYGKDFIVIQNLDLTSVIDNYSIILIPLNSIARITLDCERWYDGNQNP